MLGGDSGRYHSRNQVNGRSFMTIEWVVGIAVASLLVGLGLGYFLPLGNAKKARVRELETALETAHQELSDYKGEVFSQFSQTAEKFRNLDRSYQDLHQQLAASSVSLCGDAAKPLLLGASLAGDAEAVAVKEDVVAQAPVDAKLDDDIVVAESPVDASDEVPTLTDRDADFAPEATDATAPDAPVEDLEKRERA